MSRTVLCAKLGQELPAINYKPFANDPLGQRIYESVSMDAWKQWIEHSKRIVNEMGLDLTQKTSHDMLKTQCEAFLFGGAPVIQAQGYVPEKA